MRNAAVLFGVALLAQACSGEIVSTSGTGSDIGSSQHSLEADVAAHDTIIATRPQATTLMVERINLTLAKNNIVGTVVRDVEGRVLQSLTDGAPDTSCPYLTKTNQAPTTSCRFLVDQAMQDAVVASATLRGSIEQQVVTTYQAQLNATEVDYVRGWVGEALKSGLDVGAVHAANILREQQACDQAPTPTESAYLLGERQGKALLESTEASVLPTVPRTICNTDVVAATILAAATDEVPDFVASNPVCAGFAANQLAEQVDLGQAEQNRRSGLDEGLRAAYESLRVRLVSTWVCEVPSPPSGDPLVVDLAGKGLRFSAARATFDLAATGEPALVPVPAAGLALLAIDLDGNDRIDSGRELLSNASACGRGRCLDGIQALRELDDNADGLVDQRDSAFAALRLWFPAAHGGGEVVSLAAAGIESLGVTALPAGYADADGNVALRAVSFARADGSSGTVYDVWFGLGFERSPADPRSSGVVSTLGR
ncbi:MAG: hypothetical protein HY906_17780 [Deltaproteobacteria bacterium]|nr:hypothetical protein [Deltaproteobacteria bacterium]